MTQTCFNCGRWKSDVHTLVWGKCHLDPERPQAKKASEGCILWREPGEIEFDAQYG